MQHWYIPPQGVTFNPVPVECPNCGRCFASILNLRKHFRHALSPCKFLDELSDAQLGGLVGETSGAPSAPYLRPVKCAICGEQFTRISQAHLRTHGIGLTEYRKRYGCTSVAEGEAMWLWTTICAENPWRWIEHNRYWDREIEDWSWDWRTFTTRGHDAAAKKTVPYPLSWQMVLQHVRGMSRIGAVPSAETRRWLVFDVDAHDCPESRASGTTWRLKGLLTSLGLRVFICRSGGGKGYHLWLFFAKRLPAEEVNEFGRAVRDLIQQKRHARIDVPGAGSDTPAVCLPMGYNPKTGVWSEWLYSRTLTPAEDSVSYLRKRGQWRNTQETFLDALREVRARVQKPEANEATQVSRSISDPESGSHSVRPQPADLTPEESEWVETAPSTTRDTLRALVDFERTFAEKGATFHASRPMVIEHIVQRGGEKVVGKTVYRHIRALCDAGMMVRGKSGKKPGQASQYRISWP